MRAKLSFAFYSREFTAPFVFGNKKLSHREGILLREETDGGIRYGEAAPLPGHSKESLTQISECLKARIGDSEEYPPSLRFARSQLTDTQKLKHPVKSNALIPAHEGAGMIAAEVARAYERGYRVMKLKVNPKNLRAVVTALKEFSRSDARFRLDGNRSLSFDDVSLLSHAISAGGCLDNIDYVEEPCLDSFFDSRMHSLAFPMAADESAKSAADVARLLTAPASPRVIIVKPALFGSLDEVKRLCDDVRSRGVRVVASSALETEVGRRGVLGLLGGDDVDESHGISTGFLFKKNYWADEPSFECIPAISAEEQRYLNSLGWAAVE